MGAGVRRADLGRRRIGRKRPHHRRSVSPRHHRRRAPRVPGPGPGGGVLALIAKFDFTGKSVLVTGASRGIGRATALAMAKLISAKQFNLKNQNAQFQAFLILFFPALLITLQPDPGSALVYVAFILVLYREGLPIYYFTIAILSVLIFISTLKFGSLMSFMGSLTLMGLILLYFVFYIRASFLLQI